MFFLFRKTEPAPGHSSTSKTSKTIVGLSISTMVPAHGYMVSGAKRGIASPFGAWMRTFLGACAWAFMIAAGSLVYAHFVKKWQGSGLPMLPVAAMIAASNAQQQQSSSSPPSHSAGGLASGSPQFQRARPPGQTSFMDEYQG